MKNILTLVILFMAVSGCSGPSDEEIKTASYRCVDFYDKKRAHFGEHVEYNDHWMKNGKLVIALKVKESKWSRSYTEGLCVVNFEKGTIELPGLINYGKWEIDD